MTEAKFCEGRVQYPGGYGYISFPCGARFDTTGPSGERQLPYEYQILEERSRLAPCCYWQEGPYKFQVVKKDPKDLGEVEVLGTDGNSITTSLLDEYAVGGWSHEETPSFYITPWSQTVVGEVTTACSNNGALGWNQGTSSSSKFPCNGSLTKCPFYTGQAFQHINDEDLESGKPIIGQMVQELRSLMRDWEKYEDPQKEWERSFEVPYIWGRNFDYKEDLVEAERIARSGPTSDEFEEEGAFIILTRIYWDVVEEEAILQDFPSTPVGTELDEESPETPPSFPTIVNDLGNALTKLINITFPPNNFIHYQFGGTSKIYMSGLASNGHTVYIINSSIVDFIDLTATEALDRSDEVVAAINELLYKQNSGSTNEGFFVVSASSFGFWELQNGVGLKENEVNKIYAIVLSSNSKISYDYTEVNYLFAAAIIFQTSTKHTLGTPQSSPLITKISSINQSAPVEFTVIPIGSSELRISNAYHFFVHDKSISRFVNNLTEEQLPNQRSWSIKSESVFVEGTGHKNNKEESEGLTWYKLDKCNRYLIEIQDDRLPRVIPAGMDRSWEPTEIFFIPSGDRSIEMKVDSDFGRSLTGNILPINCIIVEPREEIDIGKYTKDSIMQVSLDIYTATNTSEDISSIPEEFFNTAVYTTGGIPVPTLTSGDVFKDFKHTLTVEGTSFSVDPSTKYDLSYMIEFSINFIPIGRKWVTGVVELGESWARDVDITYSWGAQQRFKRLIPDYYYAISTISKEGDYPREIFNDNSGWLSDQGDYSAYRPECGDHDNVTGKGPMFYPYERCSDPYYSIDTFGFSYHYRISYASYLDEKYRGPDAAYPFIYHVNALSILDCIFDFSWATLYRTVVVWLGYSRIRGPISPFFNTWRYLLAKGLGWSLPEFGNCGREHIRITRSMHYRQFLYLDNGYPKVGEGWMPAIPFVGNESIFDDGTKASNVIEQSADLGLGFKIDPYKYEDGELMLSLSTSGSSFAGNSSDIETIVLERKSFDDVYTTRKVRNSDGLGSFWPPQGYYFNFKSKQTFWAFPEKDIPTVFRKWGELKGNPLEEDKFITGITISKVTTGTVDIDPEKFNRPIHVSFPEGIYSINLNNQIYSQDGELEKYASISIGGAGKEQAYIYFDKFTGEIKDTDVNGTEQYYATDSASGTIASIGDVYTSLIYQLLPGQEPGPSSISGTISGSSLTYKRIGNFALNTEAKMYSIGNILSDPLDDSLEDNWVCFLPSLNIDNIVPSLLPQIEIELEQVLEPADIRVNFSTYPGEDPEARHTYSNVDIPNEGFLGSSTASVIYWLPLSIDEDAVVFDTYDPRIGCILSTTITIKLLKPVFVSDLELQYSLYGLEVDSWNGTGSSKTVTIEKDPYLIIKMTNLQGDTITLLEKPEYKNLEEEELSRNFMFTSSRSITGGSETGEEDTNIYFDGPIATKEISITIGARYKRTGYSIDTLNLTCRDLKEIAEEIIVTEQRYYPSAGYTNEGVPTRLPAQDPDMLTSIVSSIDMGDSYEAVGIAEYWRPGHLDLEDVGTIGKLRRHWANKFNTFDTLKYYTGIDPKAAVEFTNTAMDAESKQGIIINEMLSKSDEAMSGKLFKMTQGLYLSPYDQYLLSKLGQEAVSCSSEFNMDTTWSSKKAYAASKGTLGEGWQDPGYEACISNFAKTQKRRCGLGSSIAFSPDAQAFCRGRVEIPAFRVFDIGELRFSKLWRAGEVQDMQINEAYTGVSAAYRTYKQRYLKNLNKRFQI